MKMNECFWSNGKTVKKNHQNKQVHFACLKNKTES